MLNDILYLFFPENCCACNSSLYYFEKFVCTSCRNNLSLAHFKSYTKNPIHKIFEDYNICLATSLFVFEKNTEVQELVHNLKYRNQKYIGNVVGHWHVKKFISDKMFQNIDIVLPVPIHKKKLRKRGYNQVSDYAKILSKSINAEFCDTILKKFKNTKTQSKHSRDQRFKNILNSIEIIDKTKLIGKHVLLVDDVITTGATIKACIECLQLTQNIKISIATIAITLIDDV